MKPDIQFYPEFVAQMAADGYALNQVVKALNDSDFPPLTVLASLTGYSNDGILDGIRSPESDARRQVRQRVEDIYSPRLDRGQSLSELPPLEITKIASALGLKPAVVKGATSSRPLIFNIEGQPCQIVVTDSGSELTLIQPQTNKQDPGENLPPESLETYLYQVAPEAVAPYQWFSEVGAKSNNWDRPETGKAFADFLANLLYGAPTDFPIWNCFGFSYRQNKPGAFPIATLLDYFDTAIVGYFLKRIQEMIDVLAPIGSTCQIFILIPSNEVYGDQAGIWQFSQTVSERETIMSNMVQELTSILSPLHIPFGFPTPQVIRWDEYLKLRKVPKDQTQYSLGGYQYLLEQPTFSSICARVPTHLQTYFDQYGLVVKPTPESVERQTRYLGMYVGEGSAYLDIQASGINLAIINLEEPRVSEMNRLGSQSKIPIITPASLKEITKYYRWKKAIIAERKR